LRTTDDDKVCGKSASAKQHTKLHGTDQTEESEMYDDFIKFGSRWFIPVIKMLIAQFSL